MVDLAPHNPYSFALRSPILARAGLGGAGVERLAAIKAIGAVISDPLALERAPAARWQPVAAGMLWPDSWRDITSARRDLARWAQCSQPVLICLRPHTSDDLPALLAELDEHATSALLLDLTDSQQPGEMRALVERVRRDWRKPVFAELALDGPALDQVVPLLHQVDGFLLARGVRATVAAADGWQHGRVVGPAAHASLLAAIARLPALDTQTLIVGVSSLAEATAVRRILPAAQRCAWCLDIALWEQPHLPIALAHELGIETR